jgi:hypothetical protein
LASLFPPSIEIALPLVSPMVFGFFVVSWVVCSLVSLAFVLFFPSSSP